ncbi:MAG: branched-chain amino acid ABC transporter substrate-binding protein [Gaiellales bacterium]
MVILLLASVGAALAACGASSGSSDAVVTEPSPAAMSCTGAVGVMAPYGGRAQDDTTQMNWARVSLEKFNQEHGTSFTLRPGNVDGNPAAGRREAREMVADQNVIGVVGPKTSAVTRAIGPIFDAADLVYVSPSATNPSLTDGSLKNFYRVVASDAKQAPAMAAYIAKHLKPKKVLIVRDDEVYSQDLAAGLKDGLDGLGVASTTIGISTTQSDFADVIAAAGSDVNVVALPVLDATQATEIVHQLAKAGKYPTFIGGDALFLDSFRSPGAYVTTYAPDLSADDSAEETIRLYKTIFGEFEYYGAPSYVAMEIVLEAANEVCKEHGEVTREEMVKQLPKTRLATSILGMPIAFTPEHELEDAPMHVYQAGPGGFTLVQ